MSRLTFALVVAALAAAVGGWAHAASAPAGGVVAQDNDTFALGEGRFEIEGRTPRGLAEFRSLYLEGAQLRRGGGRSLTAIPPASVKGEVQARRKFRLKRAAFDDDRFSFETVTVGGVSFQFEGTVYNYRPGADQPISPVFKGRLTKLMNGKKVAEGQVTLGHLEPEF
jgi:hypothetical protein